MVITIIVVMSAGMVPTFLKNTGGYKMKDSARRISDLMYFSHSMAVFHATTFRVNFDRLSNRCWLSFEKDPAAEPGVFRRYNASGYSGYDLPPGVVIQEVAVRGDLEGQREGGSEMREGEYIEFHKDGTADDAVVVLTNEKAVVFSLHVAGVTSSVKIVEEPYSSQGAPAQANAAGAGEIYEMPGSAGP